MERPSRSPIAPAPHPTSLHRRPCLLRSSRAEPLQEKAAAQAVPAIGAAGGAIINTLFIDHFQDMARGHFIIRRLERKYGKEAVEATYKRA